MLLKAGDVCTAFGVVVSIDEGVTFGPPGAQAAVAPSPKPRPGDAALPIIGIDLDELMFRYELEGAIEGQATVTVVWRNGALEVVEQRAERPRISHPEFTIPPCPPPRGGWKATPGLHLPSALLNELKAAGLLVTITMFGPSDSKVHVITATDAKEVVRRLGPQLAAGVCVVQSRYPATQIADLSRQALQHWDSWGCYRTGQRTDHDGQVTIDVRVARVLPALVEWAEDVPEDLVRINAWLDPTRGNLPLVLDL